MTYFDDLLKADDFGSAVSGLARDFREKHGLPKIFQLGLAVPDVEAAAEELEKRGIGPFFIASGSPAFWHERGKERDFSGKQGLASHQGVELELLEPGEGSDFYRQHLDPDGKIVIHHLGLVVPDVDREADRLVSSGYPIWVKGKLKAGPITADFAYMDTLNDAGVIVEFICWKFMGMRVTRPPSIFHTIGRIEKWTGKRNLSF